MGRACKSDCPFVKSRQDVIDTLDGSLASLGIKLLLQRQIDARKCSDDSSTEERYCCEEEEEVKETATPTNKSSSCCDNIEVIYGNSLDLGALQHQPELFTSYILDTQLHNGRAAYVNKDGTKAIAIGHGNWEVQTSYDG